MAVLLLLSMLAGCGHQGPADLAAGDYRAWASSSGAPPAGVSVTVAGNEVTLAGSGDDVTASLGDLGEEMTLCPPEGRGRARRLDTALSVGEVQLSSPAMFGDCGDVSPERVTIVDLDSYDTSQQFPFGRWVEFCLVSDPDCAN